MLNVSGNHMRLPPTANDNIESLLDSDRRLQFDVDTNPSQAEDLCSTSFTTLHHLAAVRMSNMSWAVLKRIMSWMPSIKEICVAYNPLGDFPSVETPDGQSIAETFSGLETLDLTSTELTDFDRVLEVVGSAPHLTSLLLNGNKIRTLRLPTTSPPMLRALNQIGLRDNLLEDWESVNELARLPVLTTLILRQNPILLNCNPETARQEIIARLPKLKSLNFLEVAADERRGAELDYLKRYSKTWKEAQDSVDTKAMFAKQHPTFLQICEKYGPPDASDGKVSGNFCLCKMTVKVCKTLLLMRDR
uniref:Tubulin-specific chaperone E n=2 Tax=Schistocephalus solidus TaxID=70667 RepID=A0A0X3Q4J6_SCHSO